MASGKEAKTTPSIDLKKLTAVLHKSADDAGSNVPEEERAAYLASRASVVQARRCADTVEGQLRIG